MYKIWYFGSLLSVIHPPHCYWRDLFKGKILRSSLYPTSPNGTSSVRSISAVTFIALHAICLKPAFHAFTVTNSLWLPKYLFLPSFLSPLSLSDCVSLSVFCTFNTVLRGRAFCHVFLFIYVFVLLTW